MHAFNWPQLRGKVSCRARKNPFVASAAYACFWGSRKIQQQLVAVKWDKKRGRVSACKLMIYTFVGERNDQRKWLRSFTSGCIKGLLNAASRGSGDWLPEHHRLQHNGAKNAHQKPSFLLIALTPDERKKSVEPPPPPVAGFNCGIGSEAPKV